jgi:hypothetical protein
MPYILAVKEPTSGQGVVKIKRRIAKYYESTYIFLPTLSTTFVTPLTRYSVFIPQVFNVLCKHEVHKAFEKSNDVCGNMQITSVK